MRQFLIVAAIMATLPFLASSSVQAREYPWCAFYDWSGSTYNCGFDTLGQCQATISGVGGYCRPNPRFQPQPRARRRH
ncbi:MAG: DUF3551 domain-containing protein [Pseudolabrys sp.]|nr:DUF3551 domain-containing protein [Pseudolabrys sp.]